MPTFSIGQLAKRAGVAIDTVRYYERNQLLAPAGRLESGYRRYGDTELKRLRFIRRAKALGFTLADIRELLSLSDERSVAKVKRAAEAKLADVEQRLAELERIRNGLQDTGCRVPWPRPRGGLPDPQCTQRGGRAMKGSSRTLSTRMQRRTRPGTRAAAAVAGVHRPGLRHDGESRLAASRKSRRARLPVLLGGVPHEVHG